MLCTVPCCTSLTWPGPHVPSASHASHSAFCSIFTPGMAVVNGEHAGAFYDASYKQRSTFKHSFRRSLSTTARALQGPPLASCWHSSVISQQALALFARGGGGGGGAADYAAAWAANSSPCRASLTPQTHRHTTPPAPTTTRFCINYGRASHGHLFLREHVGATICSSQTTLCLPYCTIPSSNLLHTGPCHNPWQEQEAGTAGRRKEAPLLQSLPMGPVTTPPPHLPHT